MCLFEAMTLQAFLGPQTLVLVWAELYCTVLYWYWYWYGMVWCGTVKYGMVLHCSGIVLHCIVLVLHCIILLWYRVVLHCTVMYSGQVKNSFAGGRWSPEPPKIGGGGCGGEKGLP